MKIDPAPFVFVSTFIRMEYREKFSLHEQAKPKQNQPTADKIS